MLADPIGRAYRAPYSLFGGSGVREFADREFPREELAWVVAQTRRPPRRPARRTTAWARIRRAFRTPGEPETDAEAAPSPGSA